MTRTDLIAFLLPWIGLGAVVTVVAVVFRRRLGKAIAWLYGHLLPVVAGFILLAASWTLFFGIFGDLNRLEALYLVGLMLVAAGICQYGNELLASVTKAGPFEFVRQQRQVLRFEEQLRKIRFSQEIRTGSRDLRLSDDDTYVYEKAGQFITILEFYGLDRTKLASNEDFRDMLGLATQIATKRGDFLRAAGWVDLLIKVAKDRRERRDAHFLAGATLYRWAEASKGELKRDRFMEAIDHLRTVIELVPDDAEAYFLLAYAQDELGMFAKYNIAISRVNLGHLKAAFNQLKTIKPDDDNAALVAREALTDDELKPLREHPAWSEKVRDLLNKLISGDEAG